MLKKLLIICGLCYSISSPIMAADEFKVDATKLDDTLLDDTKLGKSTLEEHKWQVFMYLGGDSTSAADAQALSELLKVVPKNVGIYLEVHGFTHAPKELSVLSTPGRYYISNGEVKRLSDLSKSSMLGSAEVSSFIEYGLKTFPASKQVLLVSGLVDADLVGNKAKKHGFTTRMLTLGLESAGKQDIKPYFEVIYLNGSMAASLDTAVKLKSFGHYLVASQDYLAQYPEQYDWLNGLEEQPEMSSLELAETALWIYERYAGQRLEQSSVIDLTQISGLWTAYYGLVDAVTQNKSGRDVHYENVQSNAIKSEEVLYHHCAAFADHFGLATGSGFKKNRRSLIDLGGLASCLKEQYTEASGAVLAELKRAVVKQTAGEFQEGSGLSVWYPWSGEFLGSSRGLGSKSEPKSKSTRLSELFSNIKTNNLRAGELAKLKVENLAQGRYSVKLQSQQTLALEDVAVHFEVQREADGTWLDLGEVPYVDTSWEQGLVQVSFDGYWAFMDKLPLRLKLDHLMGDTYRYSVPVEVNSEMMDLMVGFFGEAKEFCVLGLIRNQESSLTGRSFYKLKTGDEITPLLGLASRAKDREESQLKLSNAHLGSFKYVQDMEIKRLPIATLPGISNYRLAFSFTGVDGKIYQGPVVDVSNIVLPASLEAEVKSK